MLYRQAGIYHTDYAATRALFPIPVERWMVGILLAFALGRAVVGLSSLDAQQLPAAVAGLDLGDLGPEPDPRLGRASSTSATRRSWASAPTPRCTARATACRGNSRSSSAA